MFSYTYQLSHNNLKFHMQFFPIDHHAISVGFTSTMIHTYRIFIAMFTLDHQFSFYRRFQFLQILVRHKSRTQKFGTWIRVLSFSQTALWLPPALVPCATVNYEHHISIIPSIKTCFWSCSNPCFQLFRTKKHNCLSLSATPLNSVGPSLLR